MNKSEGFNFKPSNHDPSYHGCIDGYSSSLLLLSSLIVNVLIESREENRGKVIRSSTKEF